MTDEGRLYLGRCWARPAPPREGLPARPALSTNVVSGGGCEVGRVHPQVRTKMTRDERGVSGGWTHVHQTPCTLHRTPCSIHHAAYSIQHTPRSIHQAACSMQHTAYGIQHTGIRTWPPDRALARESALGRSPSSRRRLSAENAPLPSTSPAGCQGAQGGGGAWEHGVGGAVWLGAGKGTFCRRPCAIQMRE